MICIVPLAGPDLVHPTLGIKPLFRSEGMPLIERALSSRPWWSNANVEYIFILRDIPETSAVKEVLDSLRPDARFVTVSHLTDGALFSALAGTAMVTDRDRPLCVDLADIIFDWTADPNETFRQYSTVGGILPVFQSTDAKYSYARIEGSRVTETREKEVISSDASAGVYLFRNSSLFLSAAAHSLTNFDTLAHSDILFVCPAMNGIIDAGYTVLPANVTNCKPVSALFH